MGAVSVKKGLGKQGRSLVLKQEDGSLRGLRPVREEREQRWKRQSLPLTQVCHHPDDQGLDTVVPGQGEYRGRSTRCVQTAPSDLGCIIEPSPRSSS